MPAELAMLHEVAPTPTALYEAFRQVCPEGSSIEFRGGQVVVLIDEMGGHVMTVFPSCRFEVDLDVLVRDATISDVPIAGARYWTDVTIPLGDDGGRERTARDVAELTNGWLYVRAEGASNE